MTENFVTPEGKLYVDKITGVLRISHESLLSGLNNIVIYDMFSDNLYTDDYGPTEEEVSELSKLTPDIKLVKAGIAFHKKSCRVKVRRRLP